MRTLSCAFLSKMDINKPIPCVSERVPVRITTVKKKNEKKNADPTVTAFFFFFFIAQSDCLLQTKRRGMHSETWITAALFIWMEMDGRLRHWAGLAL